MVVGTKVNQLMLAPTHTTAHVLSQGLTNQYGLGAAQQINHAGTQFGSHPTIPRYLKGEKTNNGLVDTKNLLDTQQSSVQYNY